MTNKVYLLGIISTIIIAGYLVPQTVDNQVQGGGSPCLLIEPSSSLYPSNPLQVNILENPVNSRFYTTVSEKQVFECGLGSQIKEVTTTIRIEENHNGIEKSKHLESITCLKEFTPLSIECNELGPLFLQGSITSFVENCSTLAVEFDSDYAGMITTQGKHKDRLIQVEKSVVKCNTVFEDLIVEIFVLEKSINRQDSQIDVIYCFIDESTAGFNGCTRNATFNPIV